jgi:hypothetical protein
MEIQKSNKEEQIEVVYKEQHGLENEILPSENSEEEDREIKEQFSSL